MRLEVSFTNAMPGLFVKDFLYSPNVTTRCRAKDASVILLKKNTDMNRAWPFFYYFSISDTNMFAVYIYLRVMSFFAIDSFLNMFCGMFQMSLLYQSLTK